MPIKWGRASHQVLRHAAQESMLFGSRARACEDSKLHVLKRRLPKLDPADHLNYIEIVCARTVELLQAVRDEYRRYLQDSGATPLAEMYWVVARYGVMDWAVMVLRDAVFEYIGRCQIKTENWEGLFGFTSLLAPFPGQEPTQKVSPTVAADAGLSNTINGLLRKNVFDQVLTGGPFGRDNQMHLGRPLLASQFGRGKETVLEAIKRRNKSCGTTATPGPKD